MVTIILILLTIVSMVSLNVAEATQTKEFTMWTVIKSVINVVATIGYIIILSIFEEAVHGVVVIVPITVAVVVGVYILTKLSTQVIGVLSMVVGVLVAAYVMWVSMVMMNTAIVDTTDFINTMIVVVSTSVGASVAGGVLIFMVFNIVSMVQDGMGREDDAVLLIGMDGDSMYTDISNMNACTDISTMGDSCAWYSSIAFKLSFQEGAKKQAAWNTLTSRALYSDIEYNDYNGYAVHDAYTLMTEEDDVYGDMQEALILKWNKKHNKSLVISYEFARQGRNDKNSK